MRLNKLKAQVETLLREVPATRDSDISLMIEVWRRFYPQFVKTGSTGEAGVWLKDLFSLPREDHIKRIRAHFQNDCGKYLPASLEVVRQRRINEEFWREEMNSNMLYKK